MATVFYDPQATVNGDGTTHLTPKNTLSGVTMGGASNAVLQKAGSIRPSGQVTITASGGGYGTEFVFGVYDPLTGNRITDGSKRAIIDGGRLTGFGIFVNNGANHVIIDGFEVRNWLSGTTASGITHQSGGGINMNVYNCWVHDIEGVTSNGTTGISFPATSGTVINCIVNDIRGPGAGGVVMSGAVPTTGDSLIQGTKIHDIDNDGIFFARKIKIKRCDIRRCGRDEALATGDPIQGSGTLGSFEITDCYLENSESNFKQTLIVQETGGTFGGLIANNIIIGCRQDIPVIGVNKTLLVDQPFCLVVGNFITEGTRALDNDDASHHVLISGNVIVQTHEGSLMGIRLGTGAGNVAVNNTLIHTAGTGVDIAGIFQAGTGVANLTIANNIIIGYEYGIKSDTFSATSVHHNCLFECTEPLVSEDLTPQTLDAASITTDPLLNGKYELGAGSPALNSGIFISDSVRDFYGKQILDIAPDMGALQTYLTREISINPRPSLVEDRVTADKREGVLRRPRLN